MGSAVQLVADLKARREDFQNKVNSLSGNAGLVAAVELARLLYPKPFELTDDACSEVAKTITDGLGRLSEFVPPPLNLAIVPLCKVLGAVVDQVRLVGENRDAAQKLSERVIEAARTISELLGCIGRADDTGARAAAASQIEGGVNDLTTLLKDQALPFLEAFHSRSYIQKMWKGKSDKDTFEQLDQGIFELLQSMDQAVGRGTLVIVKHTYEMVKEILSVVTKTYEVYGSPLDLSPSYHSF